MPEIQESNHVPSLSEAALNLCNLGFRVIPLKGLSKVARIKNWQNDASNDPEIVKSWWEQWPNSNIGVLMDGIFTVDCDPRNGGSQDVVADFIGCDLNETLSAVTGSGGSHDLYLGSVPKQKLTQGVDIQGIGSYIVASPSVHPNGTEYFWDVLDPSKVEWSDIKPPCKELLDKLQVTKPKESERFIFKPEETEGDKHMTLFRMASSLRAQGFEYDFILPPVIEACRKCVGGESVPLKNIEKIVRDACQYPPGSKAESIIENLEMDDFAPKTKDQKTGSEPIESEVENLIPYPIDDLGSFMSEPCKIIAEQIGCPVEIVANSMLAAASVCVQEHYNIEAWGGLRPLSLFFLTVAESGERKSTVDSIVLKEHYKWVEEKNSGYELERSRYKKDVEEYKESQKKKQFTQKPEAPKAPVLFVSEPTVEGLFFCLKYHRNSVGLFSDEGGTFLGGHSMRAENSKATLGKLNKLWDGAMIDRIRKGKDEGDVDMLYNKRVAAHLMIQPKVAYDLLNNEFAKDQGFLARCLISKPISSIGGRKWLFDMSPPSEIKAFYMRVRKFLDKGFHTMQPMGLAKGGEEILKEFYGRVEPLQRSGSKYSGIKGFASKAVEHALRIAGVLEAFEQEHPMYISVDSIERGVRIAEFYLKDHLEITGRTMIHDSADHQIICDFLARRPKWKYRQVVQGVPRKYRRKAVLVPLLSDLDRGGWIKFQAQTGDIVVE